MALTLKFMPLHWKLTAAPAQGFRRSSFLRIKLRGRISDDIAIFIEAFFLWFAFDILPNISVSDDVVVSCDKIPLSAAFALSLFPFLSFTCLNRRPFSTSILWRLFR